MLLNSLLGVKTVQISQSQQTLQLPHSASPWILKDILNLFLVLNNVVRPSGLHSLPETDVFHLILFAVLSD